MIPCVLCLVPCACPLAQIGWSEAGAIAGAVGLVAGVPLSMMTAYLRGIRRDQHAVNERVTTMEREAPLQFVLKDEFLRAQHRTQMLQDRAIEGLARMEAKLDAQTGIAAGMAAQTKAILALATALNDGRPGAARGET